MKISQFVISVLFVAFITKVTAQEITVFPGFWSEKYYQDDTQISKKQVETLMLSDAEASTYWQKSKNHMTIAWVAFGAEVGFLVWQLNRGNNGDSQTVPLIGVLGSAGVAIGFALSSSNLKKKAILSYNNNLETNTLYLGPTQDGLGLSLSF